METPCITDHITFDSNAFINYALLFGPVKSYFAEPLHEIINHCHERGITTGYFKFIRNQSFCNLAFAVSQFTKDRGVESKYLLMKYCEQGTEHLKKIFLNIEEFHEIVTDAEIEIARQFFIDHERDITSLLNLQHNKSNIPEDHDLKLLVCCENSSCDKMFLISDDGHFIGYSDLIPSRYAISVLPMKDVRINMIAWKWT